MADLIERKPLYEQTAKLEAQALDYVGRLIERDGEEPSEEWRVWSAILTERTAFKHDVFDAPSAEPERKKGKWIITSEFEDCYYAKCNQCNITQVFYFNKQLTKFCPECGAPMDLKGD